MCAGTGYGMSEPGNAAVTFGIAYCRDNNILIQDNLPCNMALISGKKERDESLLTRMVREWIRDVTLQGEIRGAGRLVGEDGRVGKGEKNGRR